MGILAWLIEKVNATFRGIGETALEKEMGELLHSILCELKRLSNKVDFFESSVRKCFADFEFAQTYKEIKLMLEMMKQREKEADTATYEQLRPSLESDSIYCSIIEKVKQTLGRELPPDELLSLYTIYHELRIPPEGIFVLIAHCISECVIL